MSERTSGNASAAFVHTADSAPAHARPPCKPAPLRVNGVDVLVLVMQTVDELRTGKGGVERLRDIEPDDLLGREAMQLDAAGIGEFPRGRTVLISGAGGSIGSELCRHVASYAPARLVRTS